MALVAAFRGPGSGVGPAGALADPPEEEVVAAAKDDLRLQLQIERAIVLFLGSHRARPDSPSTLAVLRSMFEVMERLGLSGSCWTVRSWIVENSDLLCMGEGLVTGRAALRAVAHIQPQGVDDFRAFWLQLWKSAPKAWRAETFEGLRIQDPEAAAELLGELCGWAGAQLGPLLKAMWDQPQARGVLLQRLKRAEREKESWLGRACTALRHQLDETAARALPRVAATGPEEEMSLDFGDSEAELPPLELPEGALADWAEVEVHVDPEHLRDRLGDTEANDPVRAPEPLEEEELGALGSMDSLAAALRAPAPDDAAPGLSARPTRRSSAPAAGKATPGDGAPQEGIAPVGTSAQVTRRVERHGSELDPTPFGVPGGLSDNGSRGQASPATLEAAEEVFRSLGARSGAAEYARRMPGGSLADALNGSIE